MPSLGSSFRWMILLALLAWTALPARAQSPLVPPVVLPDGTAFTTWEVPLEFARTLVVDPSDPNASDENSGADGQPLRTIARAAELARPGDRVLIAEGVYRERVVPRRGGEGPARMISYEAAPGDTVVLKGSRVLDGPWQLAEEPAPGAPPVWRAELPAALFPRGNPFARVNLTDETIDDCMPWAVPIKGLRQNRLRRGLVFQDGRRLEQVLQAGELAERSGTYWVEEDGLAIRVRPAGDANPQACQFEVTVDGAVFAPEAFGLGYIRVRGLTIEHSAASFPRPQLGALSTMRGHHWIIEGNRVRQCNAIAIDIGDQFATSGPDLAEGGRHIVRGNEVTDCGIGGIEGKQIEATLIEGNVLRRCGWHDIWRIYEVAGIKVHCTRSCVLRRNLVTDTIAAPGIWMDWDNINSRCTGNLTINVDCGNGGIFMEASQKPNLVDTNIVAGTRGSGIYQHDCDELTVAHNLVIGSSDAAVRMQICQGREVMGRLSTAKRNRIVNNVFVGHARPLAISDPENTSDYNVFAGTDNAFDLAAWKQQQGWDEHSVVMTLQAAIDPDRLELEWASAAELPACPLVAPVTLDYREATRSGSATSPGPLLELAPAGRRTVVVRP